MRAIPKTFNTVVLFLVALCLSSSSDAQCTYFIKLSSGKSTAQGYVLGIRFDGTLWAWGSNAYNKLGDGAGADILAPTQIGTDNDWLDVSAGGGHSLAVKTNGTLWAWGANGFGALGDGTNTDKPTPTQIGTATDWKTVSAGFRHSLALKNDGTMWTWGNNTYCQLGQGSDCTHKNVPVQVGTGTDWMMISAGSDYSLAVQSNGNSWGWGRNNRGQCGTGNSGDNNVPTAIPTGNFVYISAGNEHSMAIAPDGTAWGWGDNFVSQLGNNQLGGLERSPIQIGVQTDWVALLPGDGFTIGIRNNGTAWSWGGGDTYAWGTGSPTSKIPKQIGTDVNWESAIAGWNFGGAMKRDHSLWTWGRNAYGNLGDGTTTDVLLPKQIIAAPTGITLAAVHTSITKIQTRLNDYITDCSNLIARIQQYGTNMGLSGPITASVWLASQQPARYVKRFYQIDPSVNSGGGGKRITLYFTQQEFTDFNAVNTVKLPVDAADAANNKANLLIEKLLGTSGDGSGTPASYTGLSINTNPNDADIVWNGLNNRWELTFNSAGAGGYFIKTQTESIVPKTLDKVGLTSATPGAVAYSLRLLSSDYAGAAITVRRSSDNATQDIGFTTDGHLDTASLKSFVGAGNGYVARWYDQSGNNFPAEQANNALQPVIVNGGVIERINRRPAVYFNAAHLFTRKETIFTQAASMVGVAKGNNNTPSAFVTKTGTGAGSNPAHPGPFDYTNAGAEFTVGNASTTIFNVINTGVTTPRSTVNDQVGESVYSFVIPSSGTYYNYINGVQAGNQAVPAFADGGNSLMLGNRNDGSSTANFRTTEVILFNLALSTAERQQVESSQTLFYLSATLPVRWLSVKGQVMDNGFARISWQVAEQQVRNYQVEKSADGVRYAVVGELVSQGDGTHQYSFTDKQLLSATGWFRIRQIDLDGRATHSSVIRLMASSNGRISLYPNPAQDLATVTVGNQLLHTRASLYDLHGKQLQSMIITSTAFTISLKDYPAGIYLLKTSDGQVARIVKQGGQP